MGDTAARDFGSSNARGFSGHTRADLGRRGQPAPVLLDAANDADLLVVGSHGHGRFSGMLKGSVSTHCVEHASCPVVVVRGEARVAAAGDR